MEFRHIINGCSVNLRQLSHRELDVLVKNHRVRAALLENELESLVGEQIRRGLAQHPELSIVR